MNPRRIIALLALGLTLACGDNAPIEPLVSEPQLGVVAGASGCYAVEIESYAMGVFPAFSGSFTGDLIGTSDVLFDFAELRFDGKTIKNAGVMTWDIEGGIAPELVGATFAMEVSTMNIATPNSNKVVGRLRSLGDFPAKLNLTFNGTFNAAGSTEPPFAVDLTYKGVICP